MMLPGMALDGAIEIIIAILEFIDPILTTGYSFAVQAIELIASKI